MEITCNTGGRGRDVAAVYPRAKLADNPNADGNDPDYESRLEGLGNPALVAAMKTVTGILTTALTLASLSASAMYLPAVYDTGALAADYGF